MPKLRAEQRINDFREIELGYSAEMAIKEARRCLRCDLDTEEGRAYLESLRKKKNG
jgi:hypothetical protein